jgi:predicted rRNA methylase YqxC with S4 and FtsJ domains
MVYEELKKRNLVKNLKEFSELVWLRQIKVNDKILKNPKKEFKKVNNIKIGHYEVVF